MAVGLVIVSHSERLAEGVVELAAQMASGQVKLAAAGGTDDGSLGTSLAKVLSAIDQVYSPDGVLILVDLGSAGLVAEMALEQIPDERREHMLLSEAPVVEGAVVAAVEASIGSPLAQVAETARTAMDMNKIGSSQPS